MTRTPTAIQAGVVGLEHFAGAGRTAAERRNAATARTLFEAFARADFEVLGAHLAPDAQAVIVGLDPETFGAATGDLGFFRRLFPHGLRFQIRAVLAEGDAVCVQWEDEALTARGRHYVNTGLHLFRFTPDGTIRGYHEYLDPQRFLEVL
jgi:ketosteroid isomerase-like protein